MSVGVVLRFLKERQYGDPGAGPASPSRSARREPVRTLSRRHLARAVQDAARDRADPLYRAFGLRRLLVDLDLQADRPYRIAARDFLVGGRRHHARRFPARIGCEDADVHRARPAGARSEEHTSELQSLMRISYAVFCLKKKKHK